jgi:hypothetical protein
MITTPTGPEFVKKNDQSGARSGDHTHKLLRRLKSHVQDGYSASHDPVRLVRPARLAAGVQPRSAMVLERLLDELLPRSSVRQLVANALP